MQFLFAKPKTWLSLSFVLVLLAHLPSPRFDLHYDDYLLWAQLKGNQSLAEKGFTLAAPAIPLAEKIFNAFHFYSAKDGTVAAYRDYGNLPWWSSETALMNPLRPVAAFTHWLDFAVLDASPLLLGASNLLALLVLWAGACLLFLQLSRSVPLASLAALMLAVDFSVTANLHWLAARNSYLATGIGLFALLCFIRSREQDSGRWLGGAIVLYLLGLLTAEASIALLAYLGAYAVCMDRRGWLKGSLALLPFLLVTVLWRVFYNRFGFGADNIALYADPGRGLLEFAGQLLEVFPVTALSLLLGSDEFLSNFSPDVRARIALAAWAVIFLLVLPVRRLLQDDPRIRFMLLGSLVAIVPFATLQITSSRSTTFSAIGFFYVLAVWLGALWARRGRFNGQRVLALAVGGWHLALPLAMGLMISARLVSVSMQQDSLHEFLPTLVHADPQRPLVVVNAPVPSSLFYLPFTLAYHQQPLPSQLNALAPGLKAVSVERQDRHTFIVSSPEGLPVHNEVRLAGSDGKVLHPVFSYQLLQGLITSPDQHFSPGQTLTAGNLRITPLEMKGEVPVSVRIEFVSGDPDRMTWLYHDWADNRYHVMNPLVVGGKITLAGPLSF